MSKKPLSIEETCRVMGAVHEGRIDVPHGPLGARVAAAEVQRRQQDRQSAIAALVDRFLAWPVPRDFAPDCGITFTPINHPNCWPTGTNLFTADQARAMLEHILAPAAVPVVGRDGVKDIADDPAGFAEALRNRPADYSGS